MGGDERANVFVAVVTDEVGLVNVEDRGNRDLSFGPGQGVPRQEQLCSAGQLAPQVLRVVDAQRRCRPEPELKALHRRDVESEGDQRLVVQVLETSPGILRPKARTVYLGLLQLRHSHACPQDRVFDCLGCKNPLSRLDRYRPQELQPFRLLVQHIVSVLLAQRQQHQKVVQIKEEGDFFFVGEEPGVVVGVGFAVIFQKQLAVLRARDRPNTLKAPA